MQNPPSPSLRSEMFEFIINPATAAVELQYVPESTVAETPIEDTTPVVSSPAIQASLLEAVLENNIALVKYGFPYICSIAIVTP